MSQNVVNTKPASTGSYNHSMSPYTVASLDFSELLAVRCMETPPRNKAKKFEGRGFLRLMPQVFPAYGKLDFNTAAFFVSESQLLASSKAFHNGDSVYNGKPVVRPELYVYFVNKLLSDDEYSTIVGRTDWPLNGILESWPPVPTPQYEPILDEQFDFMWLTTYGGKVYFTYNKLNFKGRRFYKWLKSLGYDFVSFPDGDISDNSTISDAILACGLNVRISALSILAYMKIYEDFFDNPHFVNYRVNSSILHYIHDGDSDPNGYFDASSGLLSDSAVLQFYSSIKVPHKKNMYLNAWNMANSPTGLLTSRVYKDDYFLLSPLQGGITSSRDSIVFANNDRTIIGNATSGSQNLNSMFGITQWGINFLQSTYRFWRRNGLFGSKAFEQFLSRFGIKTNDFNTEFASKLYDGSQEIDFTAVMSQADTEQKTLGSYAGFGVGSLNFNFTHKSADFGYIIVLSWLTPVPIPLHGFDPSVLRRSYLDYWTPEYDGKTIRAISMMELSHSHNVDLTPSQNGDTKIFGYTDVYEEYRNAKDMVLGDFVLDRNGARNFLFARDLGYYRQRSTEKLAPQSDMVQTIANPAYNSDLTDPFQESAANGDRFYLQFKFNIELENGVMSKSAALDLNGVGDTKQQLGGTQIN